VPGAGGAAPEASEVPDALPDPGRGRLPRRARALDVVLALVALPFALAIGAVLALAVLLDSPGPVLYRSRRIGRHGAPFSMLKFRTMRHDVPGPPLSVAGDERYTPVGRWLAARRFDELPQLWNVLRGEMRLVGPRPEIEEFVQAYAAEYAVILTIPPGLTGPTQLAYAEEGHLLADVPDRQTFYRQSILPEKIAIDLGYVAWPGVLADLIILARTAALPIARAQRRLRGLAGQSGVVAPRSVYSAVGLVLALLAFLALFLFTAISPP
jgi:lipopolysaccharide/colanic/teichoic acid biosynthesis glycosyltransferase